MSLPIDYPKYRSTERRRGMAPPAERLPWGSAENLLGAALVLSLFVTSFSVDAFGGAAITYRNIGLVIAAGLASITVIQAFAPKAKSACIDDHRGKDLLALLSICYFGWTGAQNYLLQNDFIGTALPGIGLLIILGALRADLAKVVAGLRRWLFAVAVAFIIPALFNQGFEENSRTWLGILPGRYFAFSNPNAVAFLAGIAALLAIPVIRQGRGRMMLLIAFVLAILTAGYTTAIALGISIFAYLALARVKRVGHLRFGVVSLSIVTPGLLLWLPSDHALGFLSGLQERVDLSGRTFLWVSLARLARDNGNFWTGMGDIELAAYTTPVLGVNSAHSTLLQLFLSEGFITATFFIVLAGSAVNRILSSPRRASLPKANRIAFAVAVYWFVISLTSTQPGTAVGLCVILLLAVASNQRVADTPPEASAKPSTLTQPVT
ncbi:hypothetical protein GCM10027020_36580 [Nocardioides salsibiostraticola]